MVWASNAPPSLNRVKRLQKHQQSKLEVKKEVAKSAGFNTDAPMPRAKLAEFFSTHNFDL